MDVNSKQIGGDHYRKHEYQHWDWVTDIGMHYLLGCATKYVARWRNKNGVQDLQKAVHYLEKAAARDVYPPETFTIQPLNKQFMEQLHPNDAAVIRHILGGSYELAIACVKHLMDDGA